MTFVVERLATLRKHLQHLHELRPRVADAAVLVRDLSLHNDVLFSLLAVCQAVIDIAGELAGRQGATFQDYTEAVRMMGALPQFAPELIDRLATLPGLRNVLVQEYVAIDCGRVVAALQDLGPIERFVEIVAQMESGGDG